MAASAAFTVNGSTSPQSVAYNSTVTLALLSTSGVGSFEWTIIGGSDPNQTPPTITSGGSPLGATATFTMNSSAGASAGCAWIVRCRINAGVASDGKTAVAAYTSTAIVGAPNALGILPFCYGETLERNATYGIAGDLNLALGSLGAASYQGTFTSSSATAAVLQNIALADNALLRVTFIVIARNTTTGWYKKKSSTEWTRSTGGGATQLGTEDGPAAFDGTGLAVTGASIVANANGVDVKYGGSAGGHTAGTFKIYVESIPQAAAV